MPPNDLSVDLKNYRLLFNGQVEAYDVDDIHKLLLKGLKPSQITTRNQDAPDISQFNFLVDEKADKIQPPPLDDQIFESFTPFEYLIPDSYKQIDLTSYVLAKYEEHLEKTTTQKTHFALERINIELAEIKRRNVELLFKTIIYIIDVFKENQIVYGIGRGSSCASYVLFLIGLNAVDPIKFDIPVDEFFR